MDKERFKSLIKERGFSALEKDGKIIVDSIETYSNLYLDSLDSIPDNIIFNNDGFVTLEGIKEIPEGVIFRNQGGVYIASVLKFSKGVRFENVLERLVNINKNLLYKHPITSKRLELGISNSD